MDLESYVGAALREMFPTGHTIERPLTSTDLYSPESTGRDLSRRSLIRVAALVLVTAVVGMGAIAMLYLLNARPGSPGFTGSDRHASAAASTPAAGVPTLAPAIAACFSPGQEGRPEYVGLSFADGQKLAQSNNENLIVVGSSDRGCFAPVMVAILHRVEVVIDADNSIVAAESSPSARP